MPDLPPDEQSRSRPIPARDHPRPGPTRTTGRLAPSPTGGLHLGHARTFLVAWLSARSQGGRIILRVEDLDATRARPGAAEAAIRDLRWLGIDWDEGPDVGGPSSPYVQSARMDRYGAALDTLIAAERVYPCTCTRADIQRAASAPHAEDEGPTYPGTCAGRSAADARTLANEGRSFAWRFRVPPGPVAWLDRFRGPTALDPARLGGDFVVGRSGVGPSYQLAVVADDAAMGVTEVIRGDDLVPSTPRQILLIQALGLAPPEYAHIPLVLGPDRRRLAKRDESLKLATLRESGMDPEILVAHLARASGWSTELDPGPPSRWIGRFRLNVLPPAPIPLNLPTLPIPPAAGNRDITPQN